MTIPSFDSYDDELEWEFDLLDGDEYNRGDTPIHMNTERQDVLYTSAESKVTRFSWEREDIEEDTISRLEGFTYIEDNRSWSSPSTYGPDYILFQQETQVTISKTLEKLQSHFQNQESVLYQSYAPLSLLFRKKGSGITLSYKIIQEYIDLFKTVRLLVKRLDEAKCPSVLSQFRFVWDRGWDYERWKQDISLICRELDYFYDSLFDINVTRTLDGYVSVHYSPTMSFISHFKILRPSSKELQRKTTSTISIHAIDITWLHRLFELTSHGLDETKKYTVYEWFIKMVGVFSGLSTPRQQELICICEDVLGGHSLNRMTDHLENWMQTNQDIVPLYIKKRIHILPSLNLSVNRT